MLWSCDQTITTITTITQPNELPSVVLHHKTLRKMLAKECLKRKSISPSWTGTIGAVWKTGEHLILGERKWMLNMMDIVASGTTPGRLKRMKGWTKGISFLIEMESSNFSPEHNSPKSFHPPCEFTDSQEILLKTRRRWIARCSVNTIHSMNSDEAH